MTKNSIFGWVRNSAVASQPCPSGHITADKREIIDFSKLPSATSHIHKTLYSTCPLANQKEKESARLLKTNEN